METLCQFVGIRVTNSITQGVDCFNLSFHSFDGTGCNECIHVTTFDVVECCSIFVKAECPYIVVRLRNFKF